MIRSDCFGYPKMGIHEKIKALAHADVDILDKGTASIHLDVRSMTVKMKLKLPLY
jgi:hypothetical protein